jgi:hypothetical protein
MVFALADHGSVQGQGLLVFRLRIASPPHPCGGSFFPTIPGNGYPKDVRPLLGVDETQVPLPPLSLTGQPRVSFQAADGTNAPYAVVPVCTQGTAQSILSDLRRLMPGYGWAPQDAQGTQWVTSTQGGSPLYARFDGLATPQHWTLTMATNLKEVPVFPTPVPAGPDALCSSVAGLEQATPLQLSDPGADFPPGTVAVVARTTRGSVYTITDYFTCAPHFELTSNPANGSGGYPLYAVFDEREWNDANGFPFDGANLQSCDATPVGNYLTQFCRTNGSVYAEIERVAEPGKGLVTFHLLYARKN